MCNYSTMFVSYHKKTTFYNNQLKGQKQILLHYTQHCTSMKATKEVKNQLASSYPSQLLFTLHSTNTKIETHYNKA